MFDIPTIPENFMKGFNKELVQSKLKELGMNDIAQKLNDMTESEIEKKITQNPNILRKASEILKGGNPFK